MTCNLSLPFSPKIWCPQPMESCQDPCGYVPSTTRKNTKRMARRYPLPVWSNQKLIRWTTQPIQSNSSVFLFHNYTKSHRDPSSRSAVNCRRKHLDHQSQMWCTLFQTVFWMGSYVIRWAIFLSTYSLASMDVLYCIYECFYHCIQSFEP